MRFEYKKNRYEAEQFWALLIAGAAGLTTIALLDRWVGMGVVVAGVLFSIILRWHGAASNRFAFELGESEVRVIFRGKIVVFGWKDVASVVEDNNCITLTLRKNGLALPVLNDMDGYDKFKQIITKKAREYEIKTRLLGGGA